MNAAELRAATADHLDKMDNAVRAAGILPGEPLAPVLAEWRHSLAWSGEMVARMTEIGERVDARLAVEPVTKPPPLSLDKAQAEQIAEAAAAGARRGIATAGRAINRRTAALIGGALVAAILLGAGGGYFAGRNSSVATVSAVTAAAVRDGPDAAQFWLQIMQANDGRAALQSCKSTTVRSDGSRLACAIPIWVEPVPITGPRTQATK